ncbi:MAG: ABC-2 family transporter protein [Planctomycetales bacterium]
MHVYLCILRTTISERLLYRGDFAFGTLMRFLPLITQIFLWSAIYGPQRFSGARLNGYSYPDMVAYYLLTMAARAFSSMPNLSNSIAKEIRDGSLKKYLIQPVDLLGYYFFSRVAHKLVYYLVALGPFALVFFVCREFFTEPINGAMIAGFIASLILSFLIGFLMESLVGLTAFWILEISSLSFIFMMLSYFLSGHMLPLDWFPAPLSTWLQFLPFKYLAHFPAAILLGRYTTSQMIVELIVGLAWVFIFWGLNRWVFQKGLRHYGAYGG